MKNIRFYLVYGLLVLTIFFLGWHKDVYVPVAKPLEEIPQHLGEWTKIGESRFSEAVLKQLRPTDYLYRVYADAKHRQVSLYLGYHGGGPESGPIHSPKHCLPGSGWVSLSEKTKTMIIGGSSVNLVEAVYQNGGQRELFLYWFQVEGASLVSEYGLKLAEIKNSILYNRRDSAFVRISVPYQEGDDVSLETGEQFVRDFYPHIKTVLPR